MNDGKIEQAIQSYQKAILYGNLQENVLAIELVNKAITLFPTTDRLAKARAYALRSRLNESEGRIDEALKDLRIAVNQNPKELEILQNLATFQLRHEMYEDAEETCMEMLQVMPMYPGAEMILGRIELARGQKDKALARFNKVINRFADLAGPYLCRADVFLALDRNNEAVDDLMMALEINDESRPECLDMIDRMARLDAAPNLEKRLNERLEVSRNNVAWMECLGRFQESRSNTVAAIELYGMILESVKNPALASRLSQCYMNNRRWVPALEYASKAVEWAPDSFLYKGRKAKVYWYADSLEAAVRVKSECIALLPENTRFYAERGTLLEQLGRKEEALKDFNVVLERHPDNTYALLHRGRVNMSNDFAYRALDDFNECVRQDTLYTACSTAPFALLYLDRRPAAESFMREILSQEGDSAFMSAVRFYSLLNETSLAMLYLERADDISLVNYYYLMREPDLYNLRSDPRFTDFIRERQPEAEELAPVNESVAADPVPVVAEPEPVVTETVVAVPVVIGRNAGKDVEEKKIPYDVVNGMMRVKGKIKNVDTYFAFVPGSRFQISQAKAEDLLKKKVIKRSDIHGSVSDKGIVAVGSTVFFSSILLGPVTLNNVTAVVVERKNVAIQFGFDIFEENMLPDLDRAIHVIHVTIRKNK